MKKSIVFVLFALVLVSGFGSFVIAVNGATSTPPINPSNLGSEAKAVVGGAADEVQSKLNQDVEIPNGLHIAARIFFGIGADEKVALNELIIMFAFMVVMFLVVYNLVSILPFFSGSALKQVISSIVIVLIMGVSGGIKSVSIFFAGLGSGIDFLGKSPIMRLIISLVVLGIILLGTTKVSSLIKSKMDIEKARGTGAAVKRGAESGEVLSKGVDILAGNKVK